MGLYMGVGSPKFCAACLKLSMLCMDACCLTLVGCAWMVERLKHVTHKWSKYVKANTLMSRASDLALPSGGKSVRDESLELESCVEGSCTAFELSSSPSGHRRAGCGLIELLTPVMWLAETKLRIAVIGLISAVPAVVSCSCACVGKLGSCMMSASLSCRRIWNWRHWKLKKSERMSFQISLWLKIAPICGRCRCK